MNTEDKIKVMQHYAAGGKVKVKENSIGGHEGVRYRDDTADCSDLVWNWADYTYSIIEEPERIWLYEISNVKLNNGKAIKVPILDENSASCAEGWAQSGWVIHSVTPFVKEDSK